MKPVISIFQKIEISILRFILLAMTPPNETEA